MTYKVQWQPAARDDLTDVWLAAPTDVRRQITAAAREIELALQHNARHVGESRPKERRVFFAAPLGVLFEVDRRAPIVRVLKVWRFATS